MAIIASAFGLGRWGTVRGTADPYGMTTKGQATANATATADPYGMTNKRTGNRNGNREGKCKCNPILAG
jgi:hypothetical protein